MKNLSSLKGMAVLGGAHFVMDFMLGIWPVFKTLARLDLTKAGLLAGLGMFFGEGAQLIFGYLGDRGSQKNLLLLGLLLTGSVAGFAYTESHLSLFALIFLCFLGSSAFHPSAVGMIRQLNSERSGLFMTLFFLAGTLGASASQIVFAKAYENFGGHTWEFILPVFFIFLLLLLQRFPSRRPSAETKCSHRNLWSALGKNRRAIAILFLMQAMMQTVLLSFKFLLPDVLEAAGSPAWFSLGGAYAFFITGVSLMVFAVGYFIDSVPNSRLLKLAVSGAALFYGLFLLLLFFEHGAAIYLLGPVIFFLGGFMGMSYPLVINSGSRLAPPESGGLIGAVLMGAAACIASLGVIGTGFLASGSAPLKVLSLAGILFAGMILLAGTLNKSLIDSNA